MSSKKRSAKSANKLDGTRKRFQAEKKASTERLETEVKTLRAKLEAEKKASKERLEAELKTLREKLEAKVKTLRERLEAEKKASRKKLDDEKKRLRVEFEARLAKSEEELKKNIVDGPGQTHLKKYGGVIYSLIRLLDVLSTVNYYCTSHNLCRHRK